MILKNGESSMKIKTAVIVFLISAISLAGGTETIHLGGSKTLSLNGLYFAGADGIVKSLSNPAGFIYQEGNGVEFSVMNRLAQNRFESERRGLYKSFRNDEIIFGGGVFFGLTDQIKLAAAYQPDLNYNIEWPFANNFTSGDTISSLLVFDFYNRIVSDAISLSAAFRTGILSFGISPVLYRVRYESAFPVSNTLWPAQGNAAYQVEQNQDGWAYGFVIGALAELSADMRLGLSVKSGYKADLEGKGKTTVFTETETDVKSTIESPWILGLGALYSFDPKWNLNVDARYSLWSSVPKTLDLEFSNTSWGERFQQQDPLSEISGGSLNQIFRNSVDLGIGIEFLSSETFNYRFSYRYSQSHNEDEGYSMFFPTIDQHWLSLGFGLRDEFLLLDAVIAYGLGFRRTVDKMGSNTAGEYGYDVAIPSISLKYIIR
jgi:hypothetical protein